MTTKLEIKTNSYNQRRYSKPWIAIVDFTYDLKGEFKWGTWVGDHNSGSDGLLIIDVDEGDIIARGQKDFRKPQNSAPDWYQVRNGELIKLAGKAEAYHFATTR